MEHPFIPIVKSVLLNASVIALLSTGNIEIGMKSLVFLLTFGYGSWKWRSEYLDRKQRKGWHEYKNKK